ncbi:MAG: tetratricopeptide repeat protein [Nitrospirota bacterium]
MKQHPERHRSIQFGLAVTALAVACATEGPPSNLPPSASDLLLLKSAALCDQKTVFLQRYSSVPIQREPWGSGQELRIPAEHSASKAEESYFFDEDGVLVGALFTYAAGLDLAPYPVLRRTLSQLKPSLEFYLNVAKLASRANMESSALYETGDEKTTTQYLVLGDRDRPTLLQASFSVDPYVRLFSPYRKEFLDRLRNPSGTKQGQRIDSQGVEDKEPFASLQQFARGQTAQLAYCGPQNYDIAAEAYQKAIASGFSNKVWLAEAHHRLGVAWEKKGDLEKAKAEMLQSLSIRPNTPEVLNNLGTVYAKLGDKQNALAFFEKAVTLRPNYAIARYNLAEAYESVNHKRAISEYETYLALVQGIPEEADRADRARQKLKTLRR